MAPAILIDQVSLRFGRKVVLDHFTLEVAKGQNVQLAGPSGSGKSSVLRLLMGLEQPDAGRIFIQGEALTERTAWRLRRKLAYVNQDATLGEGKLREALREVLHFKANEHLHWREETVRKYFDHFRLPAELLDQDVGELSGGERQRAALVLALLLERDILLLDEVTSAIGLEAKADVIRYLTALPHTMLVISHDPQWAARVPDQVALKPAH